MQHAQTKKPNERLKIVPSDEGVREITEKVFTDVCERYEHQIEPNHQKQRL
jgi:hypothetical protein